MTDTSKMTEAEQKEYQEELQGRVEEFNKEMIPLLKKYELGLGASAFVNPDGTIGARPIMFDARKKEEEAPAEKGGESTPAPEAEKGEEAGGEVSAG